MAGARVVLAGGAILAILIDPLDVADPWPLLLFLACYLAYSLGVLGLVWTPVRFAAGWDLAAHLIDFAAFSMLIVLTQGASSPFFAYFLYLLVCGTIRWQDRGTLWTAVATVATYAVTTYSGSYILQRPGFEPGTFVIRCVYLIVITTLLWYLSLHQSRFQKEVGRLAAWPRRLSRDPGDVVTEVLEHVRMLLNAPDVVLVWQEREEDVVNLAWHRNGHVDWIREPKAAYASIVLRRLESVSFQSANASDERGRVIALTTRGFLRHRCRPIDEGFRARFDMRAVQSWPLEGELIRGRVFCLHRRRMRIDDLVLGELVAQLVLSRLEGLYTLDRLRETAALQARVRVARDLHDSLLQSQAGAALQLLAARRLLQRDPAEAQERLREVQEHLERGELEMRSFIRDLRPTPRRDSGPSNLDLRRRLQELRRRIARQWKVKVHLHVTGSLERVSEALRDDVYRLAQEALANAARHAGASVISVSLLVNDAELRLDVVDDGCGFPFHGTYDLASLNRMNQGPVTLKERVTELAGELTLKSLRTGTTLVLRLPLAQSAS